MQPVVRSRSGFGSRAEASSFAGNLREAVGGGWGLAERVGASPEGSTNAFLTPQSRMQGTGGWGFWC